MASQTQGIQQLLAAEKKAAERVAEARKRKAKRLKQAKEEAQTEMERYRVEREKQFKQYEAMVRKISLPLLELHMGTRTDIAAKIDGETKSKISGMAKSFQNNQEEVIQFLLTLAFDIKPELHTNAKLQAKLGEPAA
ncbi:unnamed protein product [Notodromas monacha]|uniref:V-type proton ATPase subunit G n=1 Tax=Notodromas monacha TaxID=399045 RepID=A0A7R9BNM7_9CRUS|nr:unnamed protein product [Notodromas monacha]CAG0918513.1 unnamed protein product [Notodromas monacha]